jgi:hypothetical protein
MVVVHVRIACIFHWLKGRLLYAARSFRVCKICWLGCAAGSAANPPNSKGSLAIFDTDFTDKSVDFHRFARNSLYRNVLAKSVFICVNRWQKIVRRAKFPWIGARLVLQIEFTAWESSSLDS